MTVVGHGGHLARLTGDLPLVSLLVGPTSVGKTTLAFAVCRVHEVRGSDLLRVRDLTVDAARSIAHVAQMAPIHKMRVIVLNLDGASQAAMNVLLKTLEESPPLTRFILIASEMPPETISSRAEILRFPLLAEAEVQEILTRRKFNPTEAQRLAALSGGQVATALNFAAGLEAKVIVLSAMRAIRERDSTALDNLATRWEDSHTNLLATLCREAITKRWRVFQDAEVEGMPNTLPLQILLALRAEIRPRLVVRASLMSVLKGAA